MSMSETLCHIPFLSDLSVNWQKRGGKTKQKNGLNFFEIGFFHSVTCIRNPHHILLVAHLILITQNSKGSQLD